MCLEQVPEQDHAVAGGVRDHLHADGQALELEGHDGGHQGRQPVLPRHLRGRREKTGRMVRCVCVFFFCVLCLCFFSGFFCMSFMIIAGTDFTKCWYIFLVCRTFRV